MTIRLTHVAVTIWLCSAVASAQTLGPLAGPPANPTYKYSTPMPQGVAIPNAVETRALGKLEFFDGFPTKATAEKLFDNLDFQHAVQAYLLGLPAVNQAANRDAILKLGPANTTVPIWEELVDSRTVELTANNNTPYTWFWLDLRGGPLVLEVPPKVLGLIDDMWYRWSGDLGITGQDHGRGGKYLILPPGYTGHVPDGFFVLRPATFSVWAAWRSFLVAGDPKPGVDMVKKFTKIYPLAQAANPPKLNFVNASEKPFNMVGPADYAFWGMLDRVVQDEPTDTVDATTLGLWASIGIRKGKPFAPDERMKKILTEAAVVGDATARAVMYRWRTPDGYYYANSAWRLGFIGGYQFEDVNGARNLDGYSGFFFYATGVTPAMDSEVVGEGSQYMAAFVDSNGNVLDGGKNYKLNLPKNIPVKNFWSIILYSDQTRSMIQTNQRFPTVGSQTKGLLVNGDGSVDVYFGPKPPPGKEKNWIETVPGTAWNMLLRLYGPLEPWFDKTWRPGEIEPQEAWAER